MVKFPIVTRVVSAGVYQWHRLQPARFKIPYFSNRIFIRFEASGLKPALTAEARAL
jgi:hypothetical protein